jgi:hypothetical protein
MLTKKCSRCGCEKYFSEFSRCSARKDGLQNYCKLCASCKTKSWQQENFEEYKLLVNKWKQKNEERIRDVSNSYKSKNAGKIKKWIAENHWRKSEYNASRRAASFNASLRLNELCQRQIKQIYKEAKTISAETGVPHHVDHIVPLRAKNCCGLHVPWNLQIIPASVNVSKGNKMPSKEDCIALRLAAR